MKVSEIMTNHPIYCMPQTTLEESARLMCENDCGEIPVVDSAQDMKPVGVITDRDIVCRSLAKDKNPLKMIVQECMTVPCVTVRPEMSLEECCRVLEEHRIRRVPVVDESGRLCGIVSQADIAIHAQEDETARVVREISEPKDASQKLR